MSREAPEQETVKGNADAPGTAPDLPETRHTREQLLDAALELFAERGFEATTTKLIAERAGVPNGLIYYYFGTKEKLLESLFTERTFLPDLQARITSACADRQTDPRLTLVEICTEFHAALQNNEPFVRILSHEEGLRPIAHLLIGQLVKQVLALLEAFLKDAQQEGTLNIVDTEMTAYALFASTLVGARSRKFSDPRISIERLVAVLLGNTP